METILRDIERDEKIEYVLEISRKITSLHEELNEAEYDYKFSEEPFRSIIKSDIERLKKRIFAYVRIYNIRLHELISL